MLSIITRYRIVRHCYPPGDPLLPFGQFTLCRACLDEITCVAVMYLTLRTGYEKHGRKNPLPFPYFRAVICRQSAPDYPRERQEFKEEGKTQVSLPFCPCGGRRSLLRSAERNSPLRFSKKLPPVRGELACGSSCASVSRCRKRSRPAGANTLTQFVCPAESVPRKKENPLTKVL